MRKRLVILGFILMLISVLIYFSGSAISTGKEAIGYLLIGLSLAGSLGLRSRTITKKTISNKSE